MTAIVTDDPVAKITQHLKTLTAAIKEKTVELKRIADEVETARTKADRDIREANEEASARMETLRRQVAPLEESIRMAQAKLDAQSSSLTQRANEHHVEAARVKAEKFAQLAALDRQVAEKVKRLESIQQTIAACQSKVAAL